MKLYRQVSADERMPEKMGFYPVVIETEQYGNHIFMAQFDDVFGFQEETTDCSMITSWLEEIPEQAEDEIEEERTERNANLIDQFIEHCKDEGVEIPDTCFESFFNA